MYRSRLFVQLMADVLRVDRPSSGDVVGAGDDGAAVGKDRQLVAFDLQTQEIRVAGELADAFESRGQFVERNARAGMASVARHCGRRARPCGCPSGRKAKEIRRACTWDNRLARGGR